ncbi:deaminase domain-containing protein [Polaribacter batillariae]|nr:deaminase domain-containing protein [Polaribacter batillariae]
MEEAVVLVTGKVIKKSSLGKNPDIKYFNNGTVKSFSFNNKRYAIMADNGDWDNGSPFYGLRSEFIKYKNIEDKKVQRSEVINSEFQRLEGVTYALANNNDNVYLPVREQIVETGGTYKYCTGVFNWSFNGEHFSNYSNVSPPTGASHTSETDCGVLDNQYLGFLNSHIGKERINGQGITETIQGNAVADIAEVLTQLKNDDPDFYFLLEQRGLLPVFQQQTTYFSQDTDTSYIFYDNQDFRNYRDFLLQYQQWFEVNRQSIFEETPVKQKFLLAHMFNEDELQILSVPEKIELLETFASVPLHDNYFGWFFRSTPYTREAIAVKVIKSVTAEQAEEFLDLLVSTKIRWFGERREFDTITKTYVVVANEVKWSLYKALFYRIDDFFGADNFTTFASEINRLALAKNGIVQTENGLIINTPEELQNLVQYSFIWNKKYNNDFKGEVEYSSVTREDETFTFTEKVCTSIAYTIQGSGQYGPSNVVPYCSDTEDTEITLNHFDLVSVSYLTNPSFLDVCEYTDCSGQHFLAFAGYIDYLLEKKNTKTIFDATMTGIQVLSLAFGVGQLLVAVRTANVIRGIIGAYTIVADTFSLTINTPSFDEYIMEAYPDDWAEYKQTLNKFDIFLGVTAGTVDVLYGAYTVAEATRFIGEVDNLFRHPDKVATLTTEQVNGLALKRKRLMAELYVLRGNASTNDIIENQIRFWRDFRSYNIPTARLGTTAEFETAAQRIFDYRIAENYTGGNCGYRSGAYTKDGVTTEVDDVIWRSVSSGVAEQEIHVFESSIQGWDRITDSEFRMLNDLARVMTNNQAQQVGDVFENITGTIKIVSERPYCSSCTNVVVQFSEMFPNVNIVLIKGTSFF